MTDIPSIDIKPIFNNIFKKYYFINFEINERIDAFDICPWFPYKSGSYKERNDMKSYELEGLEITIHEDALSKIILGSIYDKQIKQYINTNKIHKDDVYFSLQVAIWWKSQYKFVVFRTK